MSFARTIFPTWIHAMRRRAEGAPVALRVFYGMHEHRVYSAILDRKFPRDALATNLQYNQSQIGIQQHTIPGWRPATTTERHRHAHPSIQHHHHTVTINSDIPYSARTPPTLARWLKTAVANLLSSVSHAFIVWTWVSNQVGCSYCRHRAQQPIHVAWGLAQFNRTNSAPQAMGAASRMSQVAAHSTHQWRDTHRNIGKHVGTVKHARGTSFLNLPYMHK